MEESIKYVMEHINKQELQYDGFAGFCLGWNYLMLFLKATRYFKKDLNAKFQMPTFLLNISGCISDLNYEWQGNFVQG